MDDGPELKRGLFGYRKQDVETLLQARERMFQRVSDEAGRLRDEAQELRTDLGRAREDGRTAREETQAVRSELGSQLEETRGKEERGRAEAARNEERRLDAETRATALEAELREARREVSALDERLRVADATEVDLRTRLEEAPTHAPIDAMELGGVLEAAQQAIARIMEAARRTAEEDLGRVRRTREEIQTEIDRVRSWRDRVEPLARSIADAMSVAQAQMSQTAERVGEALRPMSEALTSLGSHLEELAGTVDLAAAERAGTPDRVDLTYHERRAEEPETAEHASGQELAGSPSRSGPWAGPRSAPWADPGRDPWG
jgi:chromosome segregation ATPase